MIDNKIKFPAKDKPDFIKELREKVKGYFEINEISKYGNFNLLVKTIFMLALYLVPYALMMSGFISSLPGILISWFIMGIGVAGIGMGMMHDANHGSYSKNRMVNKLLGYSLYILGGFPANWQYQHNTMHHGYTNIDGHDEDINPGAFLRISPHKPLYKIHRFQHLYAWLLYSLMTISWATMKDFRQLFRYRKTKAVLSNTDSYNWLLTKLILAKAVYYFVILVLPLILLPVAWYWILIGFFVMHFTSGLILAVIFQTAHVVPDTEYPLPDKQGNMENNWAIHQLLTTSDFAPKNRLLSWFIGGLNYQVEHHLFPNVSHVHYRKIAGYVKSLAKKYDLPYHVQPSFVKAVGSHTRMLKQLGRK